MAVIAGPTRARARAREDKPVNRQAGRTRPLHLTAAASADSRAQALSAAAAGELGRSAWEGEMANRLCWTDSTTDPRYRQVLAIRRMAYVHQGKLPTTVGDDD